MEVILAVIQPKQSVSNQEYRPKLYNVLLLDHKTALSGEKGKPTKYLPTFPLTNLLEEPRDEVLANLYQLTGGDHVGIKGERALQIQWSSDRYRESLTRFALFCVPVNKGDKLNRGFVEKSPDYPGFFSLDYIIDTLNNGTVAYPPPTKTFISQLESWLKEKHSLPGTVNILFRNRADYRVKLSVNNPAFLPSRFEGPMKSSGMVTDSTPDEIRQTAHEALTRMLAIEKCDKVVLNPVFGSAFPIKSKVDRAEVNLYWGKGIPDYRIWPPSQRSSASSSLDSLVPERYHIHKLVMEGNMASLREAVLITPHLLDERDPRQWTALHLAARYGYEQAVRILLDARCNPNVVNDMKQTPLHIASQAGHYAVVQELVRRADTKLELLDNENRTPLNLCEREQHRSQKHRKTAELIKSAIRKTRQISVYIMDGTSRMLNLANGDSTTVQQLNHQLLREFNLPAKPYSEYFTIWICSHSLELQLKPEHKPVEHINNWRKIVGMLTDAQDPSKEEPTLKWRRNAKVGVVSEEREVHHPQAIKILFHEAKHNYVNAMYPCKDQDVHTFASILIYMEQKGVYDASSAKSYLNKNIKELVPGPTLKAKGPNLSSIILKRYKEYCGALQDDIRKNPDQYQQILQRKFLEFCHNLTVYGSAFFTGILQPTSNGKHPVTCHIGVNDVGIHIINTKTRVMLHSYLYSDIHWSLPVDQPSSLEIHVNFENSPSRQVKIKSRQAGLIDHLMLKLKELHQHDDRQVDIVYGRRK